MDKKYVTTLLAEGMKIHAIRCAKGECNTCYYHSNKNCWEDVAKALDESFRFILESLEKDAS